MTGPVSRRPLATRNHRWARALAARLAAGRITPNQISAASIDFAGLGFLALAAVPAAPAPFAALLLILAALMVQARLLCNLLDGMVAVEGGKSTATGPFWNEAPDRIADLLFFWGAGLAAGQPALGLGCAALAIATAWLRELGRAEDLPPDFSGPMAKPQRMAALTLACLAAALFPTPPHGATILATMLWLILAGTVVTFARRAWRLLRALETR